MHSRGLILLMLALAASGSAQPNLAGAAKIRLALEHLRVLGSVMMIAAHPDDENTALLAYFARGRKARIAYLSVTRGEGGQNLIGPEQGDLLGVIRTQELLEAREIDGAEQLFTRAIDFGYSKSAEETLAKWGRERVLADVVWNIRRFRPDVIVLRFSGSSRDGHGHHQSSAILGKEAFFAAADKNRFPEQLKWVQPWQAKRLLWNSFSFTAQQEREAAKLPSRLELDTGTYDPVLGYSYSEIAGMSRSMHRSQGFGAAQRRGQAKNYLQHVAGAPAEKDVFDGVDTTWNRLPGGAEVDRILAGALHSFDAHHPSRTIPHLLRARPLIAQMKDLWAKLKLQELDEAVGLCSGLWLDAVADRYAAEPGAQITIRAEAINRSPADMRLVAISLEGSGGARQADAPEAELRENQPVIRELSWKISEDARYSMPYWLAGPKAGETYEIADQQLVGVPENPPVLRARFRLRVESQDVELVRPVRYRYVDRVRGELARPLTIVPAVALRLSEPVQVFPDSKSRQVELEVKANVANPSGEVRLEAPAGWSVDPKVRPFRLSDPGEQTVLVFDVTPPAGPSQGRLRAVASLGGRQISTGTEVVSYPHIEPQTVFPPSEAKLVRADIRVLAKRVGYVMGAGDQVPEALRQLGCEVTLLGPEDLALGDLGRFDAIVTGVRAYNVRPDLRANQQRLLEYVHRGGTLVVQYNVLDFGASGNPLAKIGPYPLRISRERVAVEEAPVAFPDANHPVLRTPNAISAADFEGWVQERGLYFAGEWDSRYEPLFESHDPGEPPRAGGTLYARYGQGVYIFTAYSWFRQLPAGVPGAFRIFANLLSSGKNRP